MKLSSYITLDDIRCKVEVGSKKKALVLLSELIANNADDIHQDNILSKLKERERLGSTGLGAGIAIPHCRVNGLSHAKLAFISLQDGIDFESIDNKNVDMMFCLVVPETCTEKHLQILAFLANMLSDHTTCQSLRHCTDEISLYQLICNWSPLDHQAELNISASSR